MARRRKSDVVVVICYGQQEIMERKDAMAYYLDAMRNSWGAEHERYETIYWQLYDGALEASDQVDWR